MISAQHALILSILVPLAATIAIRLLDQKPNLRETATITASIITFIIGFACLPACRVGIDAGTNAH